MFRWLSDLMVSLIETYHNRFNKCDFQNNSGEVDDDISFTYDAMTEVYYSCAASLNGEMWVLGGYNHKRQVNFK